MAPGKLIWAFGGRIARDTLGDNRDRPSFEARKCATLGRHGRSEPPARYLGLASRRYMYVDRRQELMKDRRYPALLRDKSKSKSKSK